MVTRAGGSLSRSLAEDWSATRRRSEEASALLCVREVFGGVAGRELGKRPPSRSESEARGLDSDDLGGLGDDAGEFPYIQLNIEIWECSIRKFVDISGKNKTSVDVRVPRGFQIATHNTCKLLAVLDGF